MNFDSKNSTYFVFNFLSALLWLIFIWAVRNMARNGVLPRRRRPEKMEEADDLTSSSVESHEVHVLAVDDSHVDRKVIERLLKITSCKVTAVDSGRRALQFLGLDDERSPVGFDGLKVDLIITDYCMPGMTGYELLKKIKGSSAFREVPVVIMSSENILARIDRCLEEGAEDFIVKPVKLSDVKRLKNYMFGDERNGKQGRGTCKRKLQETCQFSSSDLSSTPSSSPPSPKSFSSFSPSAELSVSEPSSPTTTLDSPTRRLKMSLL